MPISGFSSADRPLVFSLSVALTSMQSEILHRRAVVVLCVYLESIRLFSYLNGEKLVRKYVYESVWQLRSVTSVLCCDSVRDSIICIRRSFRSDNVFYCNRGLGKIGQSVECTVSFLSSSLTHLRSVYFYWFLIKFDTFQLCNRQRAKLNGNVVDIVGRYLLL